MNTETPSPASLAAAHGSERCLNCNHGEEHHTHLTGCVVCKYPRERAPEIVDRSLLKMGRWCVPNSTALICPHYAPQCSHGSMSVTGHPQCSQPPRWQSTFDGKSTGLIWCDEHKPDPTQILSNKRHGVLHLVRDRAPLPKLTVIPAGHAEKLWASGAAVMKAQNEKLTDGAGTNL